MKNGKKGNRKILDKNRSDNVYTINIGECTNILKSKTLICAEVINNIEGLLEIRDNAIHFLNKTNELEQKIFELCAASIKNYINLVNEWFNKDILDKYNFNVMPLNFKTSNFESSNIIKKQNISNFIDYINLSSVVNENSNYFTLLKIDTKFVKSVSNDGVLIQQANDGKKINIELDDKMFL